MFYGGGDKHIFCLSQLHDQPKSHVRSLYTHYVVQSTTSMQSMLKLGGSRKILKNSMLEDGYLVTFLHTRIMLKWPCIFGGSHIQQWSDAHSLLSVLLGV